MARPPYSLLVVVGLATVSLILYGGTSLKSLLASHEFTYVGDDYPPEWPIHQRNVALYPEDTHRYDLETQQGIAEWAAHIPPGGGFVRLGPSDRKFGVTMFHELQCIDVIRQALVDKKEKQEEIVHHCMNYLRQMVLCHSHTALESVRWDAPPKVVDLTRSLYQCRDWTALYEGAAANHHQWEARNSQHY